jgi:hypothetical protein
MVLNSQVFNVLDADDCVQTTNFFVFIDPDDEKHPHQNFEKEEREDHKREHNCQGTE